MKGHRRLSSLLAIRSYLIDALVFLFSPSLALFLPLVWLFHSSHEGKQEADTGRRDFYRPCPPVRWINRLYRTKGLFFFVNWCHIDIPLLLRGFVFIVFSLFFENGIIV